MGAYPQGNQKIRERHLWKQCLCPWDWYFYRERYGHRRRLPKPDRYKSYRARRRFKRLVLAELLDAQRSKYMRTIEDVLEED